MQWAAPQQTLPVWWRVCVCAGELEMRVFDTPGHTRGHVTYWLPEAKALFPGEANASLHAHTELLHVKPQRDAENGWILSTPCGEARVCVAVQERSWPTSTTVSDT